MKKVDSFMEALLVHSTTAMIGPQRMTEAVKTLLWAHDREPVNFLYDVGRNRFYTVLAVNKNERLYGTEVRQVRFYVDKEVNNALKLFVSCIRPRYFQALKVAYDFDEAKKVSARPFLYLCRGIPYSSEKARNVFESVCLLYDCPIGVRSFRHVHAFIVNNIIPVRRKNKACYRVLADLSEDMYWSIFRDDANRAAGHTLNVSRIVLVPWCSVINQTRF